MIIFLFILQFMMALNDPIEISRIDNEYPCGYNITDPFPSPFSPLTNYKVELPHNSYVKVSIYNGKDRIIFSKNSLEKGAYNFQWNLTNTDGVRVEVGVYTVEFEINSIIHNTKFTHTNELIVIF